MDLSDIDTIHLPLQSAGDIYGVENMEPKLDNAHNLPEICVNTADPESTKQKLEPVRVTASKSDTEMEAGPSHKLDRRVRWHASVSVDLEALGLCGAGDNVSASSSSKFKGLEFLSTKCGMNALWKFLKGKAGEKNLLFWLDAERIKYYAKDIEQLR